METQKKHFEYLFKKLKEGKDANLKQSRGKHHRIAAQWLTFSTEKGFELHSLFCSKDGEHDPSECVSKKNATLSVEKCAPEMAFSLIRKSALAKIKNPNEEDQEKLSEIHREAYLDFFEMFPAPPSDEEEAPTQ